MVSLSFMLVSRWELADVGAGGLAVILSLAVGPEVGVGAEVEDFGGGDGAVVGDVLGGGVALWRFGLPATWIGTGGALELEVFSKNGTVDNELVATFGSVICCGFPVFKVETGVDSAAGDAEFIKDVLANGKEPAVYLGDARGDVDIFSENEELGEVGDVGIGAAGIF